MVMETCHDHSGCLKDIENLKTENTSQWETMYKMQNKIDNIMTRLNVILGGICVALVLLVINLAIKIV